MVECGCSNEKVRLRKKEPAPPQVAPQHRKTSGNRSGYGQNGYPTEKLPERCLMLQWVLTIVHTLVNLPIAHDTHGQSISGERPEQGQGIEAAFEIISGAVTIYQVFQNSTGGRSPAARSA